MVKIHVKMINFDPDQRLHPLANPIWAPWHILCGHTSDFTVDLNLTNLADLLAIELSGKGGHLPMNL